MMKEYDQPVHPDWTADFAAFQEHYTRIIPPLWSRLSDDNQKPIYYGISSQHQICALCDKIEPEVKFRKTSHLLAAAIGNRALRSNEECDDCNEVYSKHEDELAKWLLPYRVMGQVRKRKGHPEISAGPNTSIQWDKQEKQFKILTEGSELEEVVRFTGKNEAELPMDAPSYLPFPGIKSLIRSTWLAMNLEQRRRFTYLKKIFRDEIIFSKLEWMEQMLSDRLDAFILECWEKKSNSTLKSSPFVLRLMMANYCIIWCCPDYLTNQYIPSLMPPFEKALNITKIQPRFLAIEDMTQRIERHNFCIKFTFDQVIEG